MKIRKYFAADMRQAINMAREEQGEDVVILSNRKVLGGVELVAAEDYDERVFDANLASQQTHVESRDPVAGAEVGEHSTGDGETEPAHNSDATEKVHYRSSGEPALDQVQIGQRRHVGRGLHVRHNLVLGDFPVHGPDQRMRHGLGDGRQTQQIPRTRDHLMTADPYA